MKTICLTIGIWSLCTGLTFGQKTDTVWTKAVSNRFETAMYEGDFEKAGNVCKTALDTAKTRFGWESEPFTLLLEFLGYAQLYTSDYEAMYATTRECLEIRRKVLGDKDLRTANTMTQMGVAQLRLGDVNAAEQSLRSAMAIMEEIDETKSQEYSVTLGELAELYRRQGYFLKSEALFLKSIDLEVQLFGKDRYNYALLTGNISNLYASMERWEDALRYTDISLERSEKHIGKDHPDYILALKNKGFNLAALGRYGEAEVILRHTLDIARKTIAPDDPELSYYLSTMSGLYLMTGRYDESLELKLEAARIVQHKFGETHPRYIEILSQIGRIQQAADNQSAADSCFRRSIQLMEKGGMQQKIDYAYALANLGRILQKQGKYKESGPIIDSAAAIGERLMEVRGSDFFINFGLYQALQASYENRPDDALRLLDEARPQFIESYGPTHEKSINLEALYGTFWQDKDNPGEALKHFMVAFEAIQSNFSANFRYLSVAEREKFARTYEYYQSVFYSFARTYPDMAPVQRFAFNLTLFRKELLTGYDRQLMHNRAENLDSLNARYQTVSQMIARQQTLPKDLRLELTELEQQRNDLEKQLAIRGTEVSAAPHWQQVQHKLQAGDAAIEWLQLPGKNTTPACYGALVLLPGRDAPQLVVLTNVGQIDSIFKANGSRGLQYATRTYGNTTLYTVLWKPLEAQLKGVKRIFYAPVGALHLLNFDAIPLPDGSILADHYNLVRVSNTDRILDSDFEQPIRFEQPALVIGDLDYNEIDLAAVSIETPNPYDSGWRGISGKAWPALPQTREEVQHIETILRAHKLPCTLLSGKNGTETALKRVCNSPKAPSLLHIATHGFFFERKTSGSADGLALVTAENPMFRTGLILAGANNAWQGNNNESAAKSPDDGILTADELSLLNLNGAGLVVLSACETALGDVHAYEGVYGLQRAIRLAGAQRMIISIWRVPDLQTRAFMDIFYQQLLDKNDVHAAFVAAREAMRKTYQTPYYWAGFILME